jgi:EAL and modified HD-GYP domain-containing signal transduction protein
MSKLCGFTKGKKMNLSVEDAPDMLESLSICYSTMVDKTRRAIGTRISVIASQSGSEFNIGKLLQDLNPLLSTSSKVILLAPIGFSYDDSLLSWLPPKNVILEIPAITLHDPEFQKLITVLHENGVRMAVRGRTAAPLPKDFLHMFEYAIIHDNEDRRKGQIQDQSQSIVRRVRFVIIGITSIEDADAAFVRGAAASIGWPVGETLAKSATQLNPSQGIVVKLISSVNNHADIKDIEGILKLDPALLFKLLKFINSPAFGLSIKITSFQHAVMMLGYTKLMRWLSLLLSTTSKDINAFPMMHASIRRGLFLEQIAGNNLENKDALFITGAFSLLDKITHTTFTDLFSMICVSTDIVDSITTLDGKFSDHLNLIKAIEQNDVSTMSKLTHQLSINPKEINFALLQALSSADQIEQDL